MELLDQKTKEIMEKCKVRAKEAGLQFSNDTLEYIVTNRDLINLTPKVMIPTLYDYWVNDVEVLKEEGRYKLYPGNPYETVINSRPPISFYNDNNPDWLNIMIFYHVLGHIDFFQSNILFEKTWNDDFVGTALADKRLIALLRTKHGRWVDYVLEFGRSIDNILGYFNLLPKNSLSPEQETGDKLEFFITVFLPEMAKVSAVDIMRFIETYNSFCSQNKDMADALFFAHVKTIYPEFESKYEKRDKKTKPAADVLDYIINNSPFLKKDENEWMKSVLIIVRNTGLYFAPQMRTKILNEGWASYWHDKLFISDKRIKGHEADYAKINAGVTSISRVGLNPYAIGLRLFEYIEEAGNKGKISFGFQKITDARQRNAFDAKAGKGIETIFEVRRIFSDFNLINTFVDQDFIDKYQLFVVGKRLNPNKGVYEYYVKSRKAADYKNMLIDSLYHPPYIKIDENKTNENNLYLIHVFEGKQLYKSYIQDTLMGIAYLWGGQVQLETTEIHVEKPVSENETTKYNNVRVCYTMKDKKMAKNNL